MRQILALVALLSLSLPALAQDGWGVYENGRFGYTIDIPPGFEGQGEADNGDGQRFLYNRAQITAWGGYFVIEPDFESEANSLLADDTAEGWGLTARSTTPTWASWSATKAGRVLHQQMIELCDGSGYAALRIEYAQVQRPEIDPFIDPLLASLKPIC